METRSQRVEEIMSALKQYTQERWKEICDIEEPMAVWITGKQMTELMKDKARLDFLLGENHPIAIEVEITFGGDEKKLYYLEDRESIDKAMRGEPIY